MGHNIKNPESWHSGSDIGVMYILDQLNDGKSNGDVYWKFDSSFKLDYDGGILSVSSRFYPPKYNNGDQLWDGHCRIILLGKEVKTQKFECKDLSSLKFEVELYISNIVAQVSAFVRMDLKV